MKPLDSYLKEWVNSISDKTEVEMAHLSHLFDKYQLPVSVRSPRMLQLEEITLALQEVVEQAKETK